MGALLADVARGLRAYVAVVPLFGRLSLWRYVVITAGISLGVLALLFPLAYLLTEGLMSLFRSLSLKPLLANVLWITVAVAVLSLELLLFKRVVLVVASPWMGAVAARVEAHLTGELVGEAPLSKTIVARALRLNIHLAVRELLWSLPLLVGLLIPVVNLGATAALLLVQAFFVGAGALDYTLERRLAYDGTLAFFRERRGLATGVGLGFVALLFLAVGFLVAPAWSAAAGAYALHRSGEEALVDPREEQYLRPTL